VPRSVRSTFTKDLDLDDMTGDEGDGEQPDEGDNGHDDILSVYSKYAKVADDDGDSRSNLKDGERSKRVFKAPRLGASDRI
jgi:hypothetical protein